MEVITQKGEIQPILSKIVHWLFGIEGQLRRRDWYLVTYSSLLAAVLVLFAGLLVRTPHARGGSPWLLVALAASAIIAERQSVRLSARAEISVSALPIVLAAVIYGPLAAVFVSVASLTPSLQPPYGRWLTWTSTRSLAAGAAGVAALSLLGPQDHTFGRIVAAVAMAMLIEQLGDLALGSVAGLLRGISLAEIRQAASTMLVAMPLYAPVAAVLVYAYREVSPWSVALFLFPALVAQKMFLLYGEQRSTAEELSRALTRQERSHLQFASTLVAALDASDRYTAGHSTAVAIYARDIAKRLCLNEHQQRLAHLAGLVHDVGKIGLPDGLLSKPGPLAIEERLEMEQHSLIGEDILANVEDYAQIAKIVRHHHERVDGSGYPDGLVGEAIPLLSRVIAVADAYNAMTSQRSYRNAMPSSVARIRLARGVGSQFDTSVVAAFEAVLASATEEYRVGQGPAFSLDGQRRASSLHDAPRRLLEVVAS